MHTSQIAQAVAAGKHIFCEKPLALNAKEAARSVALCAEAGLVLGMGHERRWEPPVAEMLAQADAGELGRIQQIEANFSHDKFVSLDKDNWRVKATEAPAGGMTATGIHLLDLSVRLLGPAESVLCICEQLSSDLPQGDTVARMSSLPVAARLMFQPRSPTRSCRASLSMDRRAGSTFATKPMSKRLTGGSSLLPWPAALSKPSKSARPNR
jgi:predicted dehydrogenase